MPDLTPRQAAETVQSVGDGTGFGAALREARRGVMIQAELARLIGLDNTTISKWETRAQKRPPTVDIVTEIENILGVTDGRLLRAAGYQAPAMTPDEFNQRAEAILRQAFTEIIRLSREYFAT